MKNQIILLILFVIAMICLPFLAFEKHQDKSDIPYTPPPETQKEIQVFGEDIVEPDESVDKTDLEKSKSEDEPETVQDFDGGEKYDVESFKILDLTSGKVDTVPVLDYVIGTVMSEIPASYQVEAIKAQAVAAHTYALHHHLTQLENPDPNLKGADFSADPSSHQGFMTTDTAKERFGTKYNEYYKKISAAVSEVIDQILIYDDEPIIAAYHAISAGQTEDAANVWKGSADYLVAVDSKGDEYSPEYESIVAVTFDELKTAMSKENPDVVFDGDDPEKWVEIVSKSDSGYITEIRVGDTTMSGMDFRTMLGLRSSNFSISFSGNGFAFVVKGYGHGVGMSQYGSDYMARQGAKYREILGHYYQNTEIVNIKSKK